MIIPAPIPNATTTATDGASLIAYIPYYYANAVNAAPAMNSLPNPFIMLLIELSPFILLAMASAS